jgi:hypothetical protein
MLIYVETRQPWRGERIDGIRHPPNIESLWIDEKLRAIGLERAPDSVPEPRRLALADYQRALEAHVEAVAAERSYSSAVSLATYGNSSVLEWKAEAAAFVVWRDAVWSHALSELAMVQSGGEPPALDRFIASLPKIEWPE